MALLNGIISLLAGCPPYVLGANWRAFGAPEHFHCQRGQIGIDSLRVITILMELMGQFRLENRQGFSSEGAIQVSSTPSEMLIQVCFVGGYRTVEVAIVGVGETAVGVGFSELRIEGDGLGKFLDR